MAETSETSEHGNDLKVDIQQKEVTYKVEKINLNEESVDPERCTQNDIAFAEQKNDKANIVSQKDSEEKEVIRENYHLKQSEDRGTTEAESSIDTKNIASNFAVMPGEVKTGKTKTIAPKDDLINTDVNTTDRPTVTKSSLGSSIELEDAEEGELDYEEDREEGEALVEGMDKKSQEEGEVEGKTQGDDEEGEIKDDDEEEGEIKDDEGSEEGEIISDDEGKKKSSQSAEEGEIPDSDNLEEGQLDEAEERGHRPRTLCKYFDAGNCRWGAACRFLHPGINDKGNYLMHRPVGMYPTAFGKPPPAIELGPMLAMPPVPHLPNVIMPVMGPLPVFPEPQVPGPMEMMPGEPPAPLPPRKETAWERGLKKAKEIRMASMRRREEDENFEEKKMVLSVQGVVEPDTISPRRDIRRPFERDRREEPPPRPRRPDFGPPEFRPDDHDRRYRGRGSPPNRYERDRERVREREWERDRYPRRPSRRSLSPPPGPDRRSRDDRPDYRRERRPSPPRNDDQFRRQPPFEPPDRNRRKDRPEKERMDKQDRSVKDDKPVKPEAQEKQEKPDKLDEKESVEQKDAPTSSESHPVTKIMAAEQWRDPWMRTQPLIPKAKSPEVTSPHLSHSSYSSSDTSDTDDTDTDTDSDDSESDSGSGTDSDKSEMASPKSLGTSKTAEPQSTTSTNSKPIDPRKPGAKPASSSATRSTDPRLAKKPSPKPRSRPTSPKRSDPRKPGDRPRNRSHDRHRRRHSSRSPRKHSPRRGPPGRDSPRRRDHRDRHRHHHRDGPHDRNKKPDPIPPNPSDVKKPGYHGQEHPLTSAAYQQAAYHQFMADSYMSAIKHVNKVPERSSSRSDRDRRRPRDSRSSPGSTKDLRSKRDSHREGSPSRRPGTGDDRKDKKDEEKSQTDESKTKKPAKETDMMDAALGQGTPKSDDDDDSVSSFGSPNANSKHSGSGSDSGSESGSDSDTGSESESDSESEGSGSETEDSDSDSGSDSEDGGEKENQETTKGSIPGRRSSKDSQDGSRKTTSEKRPDKPKETVKKDPTSSRTSSQNGRSTAGQKRPAEVSPPKSDANSTKTAARKEELLRELKAIEDAIARKRAKIE